MADTMTMGNQEVAFAPETQTDGGDKHKDVSAQQQVPSNNNKGQASGDDPTVPSRQVFKALGAVNSVAVIVFLGHVVYNAFHRLGWSFEHVTVLDQISWCSAIVEAVGLLSLLAKICWQKSVQGISGKTVICYSCEYFLRSICSAGNFMYPESSWTLLSFDIFDLLSFVMALMVLYCIFGTYRNSYEEHKDTFPVQYQLLVCLVLPLVLVADVETGPVKNYIWSACLYLEMTALLPQIHMFGKAGSRVDALVSHFVAATTCSRLLDVVYWYHAFALVAPADGSFNFSGWLVVACHVGHALLLCDFMYRYLQSWFQGQGGTVAPQPEKPKVPMRGGADLETKLFFGTGFVVGGLLVASWARGDFHSSSVMDKVSWCAILAEGLGLLALRLKIGRDKSVAGISGKTMLCYSLEHFLRSLCSVGDLISGDATWTVLAYAVMDLVAIAMAVRVLCCIFGKHRASYEKDKDTFPVEYQILVCLLLPLVLGADVGMGFAKNYIWSACLYLEMTALLPQIHMFGKTGGSSRVRDAWVSRFVAATTCSRFLDMVYWYHAFALVAPADGSFNFSGWLVVACHTGHALLLSRFMCRYVKSWFNNQAADHEAGFKKRD